MATLLIFLLVGFAAIMPAALLCKIWSDYVIADLCQ